MPGEALGDFPQVSNDPDVNRTMNLVQVLTLIIDGYVSDSQKISSVLSGVKIIR